MTAIAAADPPPFEVLVVDGDEEESSRVVTESFPDVRYVTSPRGLTRQRNRALDTALGDVVVFVDDDARVPADCLTRVADLYADPSVVGATGLVVEPHANRVGGKSASIRRLLPGGGRDGTFTRYGYPRRLTEPDRPQDVEIMQGAFMTSRRAVAAEVRFDERLAGYGLAEDEDFSCRLARRGIIRYDPDLVVHHDNEGFLARDTRTFGHHVVRNRLYLFRKNFRQNPGAIAQFWLLLCLLILHRLLNRDPRGALGLVEGMWRALSGRDQL